MTVHCPHCSAEYLLPDHLLGPRGARVRCPNCSQGFVVLRDPASSAPTVATEVVATPPAAPDPEARAAAPNADTESAGLEGRPEQVAARVLEAMSAALGSRLEQARSAGRLLTEHGADLMLAWDEYRRTLGERADPGVFREALRQRWQVDLGVPPPESSAHEGG